MQRIFDSTLEFMSALAGQLPWYRMVKHFNALDWDDDDE